MLWNASGLIGYAIEATDGLIGHVHDFLFDDERWTIRWLVLDTGAWLLGRRVLLPSSSLGEPAVARRHETELYRHYGWEPYWVATDGLAPPVAPHLKTAGGKPDRAADRAKG